MRQLALFTVAVCSLAGRTPALAMDHALIPGPAAAIDGAIGTRNMVRATTQPRPRLVEGDRWICCVGQSVVTQAEAKRRAIEQGHGYWSFAAHANCPAGVYLTEVREGKLIATGLDPWGEAAVSPYIASPSKAWASPMPPYPGAVPLEWSQLGNSSFDDCPACRRW